MLISSRSTATPPRRRAAYALCALARVALSSSAVASGSRRKCAPETIDKMYAEDPRAATFVMGYRSVFLGKSGVGVAALSSAPAIGRRRRAEPV